MNQYTLIAAKRSHAEQILDVLVNAFYDDPYYSFVFDKQRGGYDKRLRWFFNRPLQLALAGEGYIYVTPDVRGVTIWMKPGFDLGLSQLLRMGLPAAPFKLGVGPVSRFLRFQRYLDQGIAQHVPEQHWYLLLLAVDPSHQRQGIGGQLLDHALWHPDNDELPTYLETFSEGNLGLYQQHGFAVVHEGRPQTDWPQVWQLVRPGIEKDHEAEAKAAKAEAQAAKEESKTIGKPDGASAAQN